MTAMAGHADEIDEAVIDWMKDLTREEVFELSQELRIPFTKVQSIPEVISDPQNGARAFFREAEPSSGRDAEVSGHAPGTVERRGTAESGAAC